MKKTYIPYIVIVIVLLVAAGVYAYMLMNGSNGKTAQTEGTVTQYSCTEGSFTALFTDKQVALTFPDGRMLTLPQAVSGSGVRYEQDGVAFVGKGDDAFITENDVTTYTDCVANAAPSDTATGDTPSGISTFSDTGKTFRFSYPDMLSVTGGGAGYTNDWMNGSTQLGLVLAHVTLPGTFQPKTNFSDARFTVGTSADPAAVAGCLTGGNGNPVATSQVSIKGTNYTKLTFGDAGAGNFYETTSYRTVRNSQCYTVEYTIHSTNIGNYSPDQGIKAFDKASVTKVMEDMVQSFTFL